MLNSACRDISQLSRYAATNSHGLCAQAAEHAGKQVVTNWRAACAEQLASGETHMLRITETSEDGKTTRLRMDGTVDADSFSDLLAVCSRRNDIGENLIVLDLSGVDFMTEEAARKLTVLRSERLRIINCSPFVETLLRVCSDKA
jgi:hypothetical protein